MKNLLLTTFLNLLIISLQAQIRVAPIFGDHAVLQQQAEVPVWGWAGPLQEITVAGSWDNKVVKAIADHNARWNVKLLTPQAGGPYTITVTSHYQTVTLNDVMIGEVWICSGQSNMEWSVYNGAADAAEEAPNANFPNIRLFHINKSASEFPQMRNEGTWQLCTPQSMKGFSAVGYYFGKKLHLDLNVPIGLISSCWGGTQAEAWTPDSLVMDNPRLRDAARAKPLEPWGTNQPGNIFNAMIYPLMPFTVAGAIWYHGESNVGTPGTYKELMEAMIGSWRKGFKKDFPFYYVQIAPFAGYGGGKSFLLREQQTKMLSIPNTGMVVVSDVVDNVNDIHPKFKKPVGERLADVALTKTYGRQGHPHQYPLYKLMKIEKGKIILTFENCPGGLMSKDGDPKEFTIAGEDRKFVPAKAVIKGNTITVSSKEIKKPVAVRFAWTNGSIGNIFSKEGLPVTCFRTDEWED